jgi:polar amino acid transport system substrate-binding protein
MQHLSKLRRRLVTAAAAIVAVTMLVACGGCSGTGGTNAGSGTGTTGAGQLKTLKAGVLSVGTVSDAKPNAWIENGQFKGFDLDLIKSIAERIGLKVEFRAIDFAALFPSVASNKFDIGAASSAGTIERQKIVDFSDGYLIGYLGVLTKKDSGITKDPKSTDGKRIGILQGSIQESYAKRDLPGATPVLFADNNAGISALQSGRIDGYFLDFVVGVDYIQQHPELYQPLAVPAFDLPAAFPIRKGNTELKTAVNKALKETVTDGTYKRLYKQYFPSVPLPPKLPPYELPKP